MIGYQKQFTVTTNDIEYLTNTMLEKEKPMTGREMAQLLIQRQLDDEKAAFEERYKHTSIYSPADAYEEGERLVFSEMGYATATVKFIRQGQNKDYGEFSVIGVEFDDDEHNNSDGYREFASQLKVPHTLIEKAGEGPEDAPEDISPDDILKKQYPRIMHALHTALQGHPELRRVGDKWFMSALVLEIDIGTLHLAEAVLDMMGGGPMTASEIIAQIGPVGDTPMPLQEFSLNIAMNKDDRFDEVGPSGEVQWYLRRMEPESVQETPQLLRYSPISYDEDLLTADLFDLETELDDEHTPIDFEGTLQKASTVLIYPHRRAGTLPLNAKTRQIFPRGRTPRIHVTLIDALDNETYDGWVVHQDKYVYGLMEYFNKHHLPIGAYLSVEKGDDPGQIIVSHDSYNSRKEWLPVVIPHKDQILFENKKRAIGAEYDDLFILGVDNLEMVDALVQNHRAQNLMSLLRILINELGKLTPQGAVHAIQLYSAVNIFRRVPPGPIFATLRANPEFEDVGDYYWKLRDS